MNQFQSVIEGLLGWLTGIARSLWGLFTGTGSGGLPGWFSAHWKGLLIALCVLGVALDLLVYLLRWKPYRVWDSFFRRRTEKAMERELWDEELQDDPGPDPEPPRDIYAAPMADEAEEELARRRRDARSNARAAGLITGLGADGSDVSHLVYEAPAPAMDAADAYSEPYIPPQWRDPGDVGAAAPRRRRYQPDEHT